MIVAKLNLTNLHKESFIWLLLEGFASGWKDIKILNSKIWCINVHDQTNAFQLIASYLRTICNLQKIEPLHDETISAMINGNSRYCGTQLFTKIRQIFHKATCTLKGANESIK